MGAQAVLEGAARVDLQRPAPSASRALRSSLTGNLGRAYLLARRVLGDPERAEDAVQEAALRCIRRPPDSAEPRAAAAFFLSAVHGAAVDLLRSDVARRAREEGSAMRDHDAPVSPAGREAARAAQGEMEHLPPNLRAAVCLCCEQGFTQREAAEILGMPLSTLSERVQKGLDRLRRRMAARGFAAMTGAGAARILTAAGVPAVPARLAEKHAVLMAGKTVTTSAVASSASVALKGGLIMKIGLAVAATGLAVGGAFWAAGGKAGESAKSREKSKSAFATPVTDPNAEWEFDGLWAGGGYQGSNHGMVDGPRRGVRSATTPGPGVFTEDGGENVFRKYDEKLDRFFTVAGNGAPGDLDGTVPLSRVRLGGWGYGTHGGISRSGDRYVYMVALSGSERAIKRLDFEKRVMETFMDSKQLGAGGLHVCAYDGGVFITTGTRARQVSNDGKVLRDLRLSWWPPGYASAPWCYDPVHDRLYGCGREGEGKDGWVNWYWDLKAGGKFVGLIPSEWNPVTGPLRKSMATGPFKGSKFWCPNGLWWGPDDPEYRYLYMGGGDENSFYRLDLKKQYWVKFKPKGLDKFKGDGRMPDVKRFHFGDSTGEMTINARAGGLAKNGDFYSGYRNECFKWKRVQ